MHKNPIVVEQPNSNSNYYVFNVIGGGVSTSTGAGLFYNVIDMNLGLDWAL